MTSDNPTSATTRRTAVISGGGTGIGAAIASILVESGVDVLLLGRRQDRLESTAAELRRLSPTAIIHTAPTDLTDPVAVTAAANTAKELFGQVDIVVANAGSPAPKAESDLSSLAHSWLATFKSNTLSAVLLVAALEPILTAPGGRIIIIGSAAAARGNSTPSYAASKGALEAWVRTLGNSFGPRGITANVIAPGYTEGTELVAGRISPERHERLVAAISLGRAASVGEIAAAALFLASPESSYVTGQTISVDGGSRC
jgi:3-oxoacyl-[acyl-carrier protein] reductase